jgi:Na+/melibiose symporter-like transporter
MVYNHCNRSQRNFALRNQHELAYHFRERKIGYGMGDAASHIIFDNVMLYMMFFYTDIFGIPAGFVGTMFLLARALDAISDPAWA